MRPNLWRTTFAQGSPASHTAPVLHDGRVRRERTAFFGLFDPDATARSTRAGCSTVVHAQATCHQAPLCAGRHSQPLSHLRHPTYMR
jgi:hypothetical protein